MIVGRYLVKEIAQTAFAVGVVLLLIGLSAQLVGLFADVTSGELSINTVMIVLGLKTLSMLMVILPLALFLAVLMTLSRFYQNNEMAAIMACGIGPAYLLRAVLSFALLFAIVVGIFSLQLVPWANNLRQQLTAEVNSRSDLEGISAGRFREMSSGVGVVYVEGVNQERTRMQSVFVQRQEKKGSSVIRARSGFQTVNPDSGDRFMVLEHGMRFDGRPGKDGYTVVEFEQHGVRIREKSVKRIHLWGSSIPTRELFKAKHPHLRAELHARFAPIFLCLFFAALAIPLSKTSPRQGRYTRLAFGLLAYIVITNLVNVGKVWIENGTISDKLGLWWVHGLVLLLVIFLTLQQYGWRYLLRRKVK